MKVFQYENVEFIVGEHDIDNWKIIDNAESHHVWMHLKDFPSPHIIIKKGIYDLKIEAELNGLSSYHNYLNYGAKLCKQRSSSKYRCMRNLTVIYTEISNISKGRKAGEVFTKETKEIKNI
jgi:predicted ribosome quality control (RQC) complex YloA/Tae2 family protein